MNRHPTDPAQLARWLKTPRQAASRVDYACSVTVHQAVGSVQRALWAWAVAILGGVLAFHLIARSLP